MKTKTQRIKLARKHIARTRRQLNHARRHVSLLESELAFYQAIISEIQKP